MSALERHLTVNELAVLWKLSRATITKIFRDRADVIRLGRPETRSRRSYVSLRIPLRVAEKVHAELCKARYADGTPARAA